MGATDSQWAEFNTLIKGIYSDPHSVDFAAVAAKIGEMRKAGTKFGKLVVKLRVEWPMGTKFLAAYDTAIQAGIELPPIEWQGRKDSPLNPDYENTAELVAKFNATAAKAATGNPFADKLAALAR